MLIKFLGVALSVTFILSTALLGSRAGSADGSEAAPTEHAVGAAPAREGLDTSPPPVQKLSIKLRVALDSPEVARLHAQFGTHLIRHNAWTGVATLHAPTSEAVDHLARELAQNPLVEWAEPVRTYRLFDTTMAPVIPNDESYASDQKWYYDLISAPGAWGIETGKPSTIIAVLDSGVLCTHPDLAGNIWKNPNEIPANGIDDDKNGYIDDVNGYDFAGSETGIPDENIKPEVPHDPDPCIKAGDASVGNGLDDDKDGVADLGVSHGTRVAGVAAAVTNNLRGVAGMCWGCTIMVVRVANPEASIESSDMAEGITYAAKNGAKVINVSLGGAEGQGDRAVTEAIDLAVNTGVVVVAAAGNTNQHPISYPASLPNVIAVGASNHAGPKGRAPFSNWGSGGADDRQVDVIAPGVDLLSTGVTSAFDQVTGAAQAGSARYSPAEGTSFSAPLVAGLVGLMLSRNPSLTPAQVKEILKSTAGYLPDDPQDTPNAGPCWAGAGMINAETALNAALPSAAPPATPTPTPLPAGSAPRLTTPTRCSNLAGLGTTLTWNNPPGTTQFQIQIVPINNDGPGINLIQNAATTYTVQAPVFGAGPYVMLPGMTYSWRARSTAAAAAVDEASNLWGPWSEYSGFRTRHATSQGIAAQSPPDRATGIEANPTLQWSNSDSEVFYYEVQVSKDKDFILDPPRAKAAVYWELRHGGATNPPNSYLIPPLSPLEARTTYFWRVRPRIQGDGISTGWSQVFSFTTR